MGVGVVIVSRMDKRNLEPKDIHVPTTAPLVEQGAISGALKFITHSLISWKTIMNNPIQTNDIEDVVQLLEDLQTLLDQGRIEIRETPDGPEYRVKEDNDELSWMQLVHG